MISILACSSAQLGAGTFPSGHLIPLRTFPPKTTPRIFHIKQFTRKRMGNEAELLYCIVFEHLYIAPLAAASPQKASNSSDYNFQSLTVYPGVLIGGYGNTPLTRRRHIEVYKRQWRWLRHAMDESGGKVYSVKSVTQSTVS